MTVSILNSSDTGAYPVCPSAFQLIEGPLYYLNNNLNKTLLYRERNANNLFRSQLADFLEGTQRIVISHLCWPIIMCATPFTASVDIGVGICEAFYAKYKGATFHQISLIIQKKIIASPIQHLAYVVTNLAIPLICASVPMLAIFLMTSLPFSPISLFVGSCLLAVIAAPSMALLNYHTAQKLIGQSLPAWTHPEGFNIFINGGSLDSFGHKITDEDYTNIEASFYKWARERIKKQLEEKHNLQRNEQIESVHKRLQDKITIVNACQDNEFKSFFNSFLKNPNSSASNLLQLKPGFHMKDIKKAYFKWSLILHPDKHTEEGLKEVAEILFKSVLRPARLELERNL